MDLRSIDEAQSRLTDALATNGPEFHAEIERAHAIKTTIPSVDNLLPYCSGEREQHVLARAVFLGSLLSASVEPVEPDGRRRQREADAAADHLLDAAGLLDGLDNGMLGDLLRMLTEAVRTNAATCELRPVKLSDVTIGLPEVVSGVHQRQGKMLFCVPRPLRLSETFTSSRGRESRRANVLRMVTQKLRDDAPASAIARLLRDVLDIPCSEADVGQALRQQPAPGTDDNDLGNVMQNWARS